MAYVLEKCLHHAHRHGSVQHGLSRDDGDHHVGKAGQKADQRVHTVGQKIRFLVGGPVLFRSRGYLL